MVLARSVPLQMKQPAKQQIVCAKSFGREISSLAEMEEAVSTYAARVAEKLREQDSQASRITVFVRTNPFDTQREQYANEFTIDLPHPTAFTPALLTYALKGLHAIYRDGYQFKKAGVVLSRITPLPILQPDLFGEVTLHEHEQEMRLMAIVDAINRIFGRDTLVFAIQGFARTWHMRQSLLSNRFTSRWDEILTI